MLFIFSTSVLIRHLWQLKTIVFLQWCLIQVRVLRERFFYSVNVLKDRWASVAYGFNKGTEEKVKEKSQRSLFQLELNFIKLFFNWRNFQKRAELDVGWVPVAQWWNNRIKILRWGVRMPKSNTPGYIFTTLHFLCSLWIGANKLEC